MPVSSIASPLVALSPAEFLRRVAARIDAGQGGAQATVVARHGSAPATPGQKIYLGADGVAFGTVGGGAIEKAVLADLAAIAASPRSAPFRTVEHKLGAALGMCCGGRVTLVLEPVPARLPVLIVGGGHVGAALAPLLAMLDFAVTLADARESFGESGRFPGVLSLPVDHDEAGRMLPEEAAIAVMTHDHQLDQEVIEWAFRRRFGFVGGVGSRAKAERTRQRLELKGFSETDRGRLRMPVGVDIGARSPAEIAVAIAAELIAYRASLTESR